MEIASINVIAFATIKGNWKINIPYINQKTTPVIKIKNIKRDMSFVLFVFQALIAWGTKAIVVQKPAKKPI